MTGLLILCAKNLEIVRHFQSKLCGEKTQLCGKLRGKFGDTHLTSTPIVLGQNKTQIFSQSTRSIISFLHNRIALSCSVCNSQDRLRWQAQNTHYKWSLHKIRMNILYLDGETVTDRTFALHSGRRLLLCATKYSLKCWCYIWSSSHTGSSI